MKLRLGSVVRLSTSIILCYSIYYYCGVFSDPEFQSKLARFNVTRWLENKLPLRTLNLGNNYVCLPVGGRLGNNMYKFASLYGIARRQNFTILLTPEDEVMQYFNISSDVHLAPGRYICQTFHKVLEKHACCTFDYTLMNLPLGRNYMVGDWLQSWKYFQHVFPELRKQFTFKTDIKENAEYIVNNFRYSSIGNATIIGIHIRVGDMINNQYLQEVGYKPAPASYIHHAIDYMINKYDNIVFIVCSDDKKYAEEVIGDRDVEIYYFSISPVVDMAILAECDHMIMTVGTYGWWAGFLTGGTVVYYKYPHRPYSEIWRAHKFGDYSDFYPPSWIAMK